MSFINIINESFDKQNKNILAGSKGKKLDEAVKKYNNLDVIITTQADGSLEIASLFDTLRKNNVKVISAYTNGGGIDFFIDSDADLGDINYKLLKRNNYNRLSAYPAYYSNLIQDLKSVENTDNWIDRYVSFFELTPWSGDIGNYAGGIDHYNIDTLQRERHTTDSYHVDSDKIEKDVNFDSSFNDHSDELDTFYDYIFDAAEDLGFQDFDVFDDGWTVTLTYIDSVGNKKQAEFDFDYIDFIRDVDFESKEDAIDFLKSLDWKVVDDEDDLDENTQAKKLECKSRGLTEAQGDFNPATLKKYGVVRDPANDFVDDGNRFTAYLYKGVIPISYLKSKGQVYLSIAFRDLDDVNYDEYKNFESYQDGDKYNGVPADSVDVEDFVSILERAKKDYEEFKASVKAPNIDDYKAFRKVYADYFKKVSEKAKKLIADNIDTIADLSDYELKKIFEYYKSIKSQLSRWINDDAISQMSPSAIRHDLSPESIERQKKQIANIDDYFYLRYIRDYIEGDKAK